MTSPDDPLMRSVLGAASGGRAGGTCPDAEVLGLYAERALDGEERAFVEAHVARCGRCQEALAAFVRSAPEPQGTGDAAGALAWWQGWRWVVPLAATAGAAMLAVWIGRAPSRQAENLTRGAAVRETDAVQAPAATPAGAATGAAPGTSDLKTAPGPPADLAAEVPRANAGQTTAALEKSKAAAVAGTAAVPLTQNAAGARADAAPTETRQALRDVGADKAVGRLAESAPAAATPAAPSVAPRAAAAPPPPARASAQATPAATADFAAPEAPTAPGSPTTATATADARFRAAPGGRAEQEPAPKAAEATAPAKAEVAGAASRDARGGPTPWRLQAGVVERSTDGGRTWTRVTLPVKDAVRTLVVVNPTTATVTTASGATFRTADGGVTWRRVRP